MRRVAIELGRQQGMNGAADQRARVVSTVDIAQIDVRGASPSALADRERT